MLNITLESLTCPNGDPSQPELVINLTSIRRAERRIDEVATLTAQKAPELNAFFNREFMACNEILRGLESHLNKATRAANRKQAQVLLDEAPGLLSAKGLTNARSPGGSEDYRNAILAMDDEYQDLLERAEQLKAAFTFMREKQEGIQMAYMSSRKLMGDSDQKYPLRGQSFGNYAPETATIGDTVTVPESPRTTMFAKPKL